MGIITLLSLENLNKCYINGEFIDSLNGQKIEVFNPANGEVIGTVPDMGKAETEQAISKANLAFKGWSKLTANIRAEFLIKWHDLIIENIDELANILTLEQGKPLAQSKGEILNGVAFIKWFAEEGKRTYGDIVPSNNNGQRIHIIKQPIGVSAAITPWNFPSSMITRKASAAMAAGCTIVLKPSELTPFSALALAKLADEAGIPKGVFNIITGDAKEIGEELTGNDIIRKLSFTGSTAIGKKLYQQSANSIKKLSLELGGNAPFIIFDDANLNDAVDNAMASKFRNSGQTCICANRIFVQSGIYDEFMELFTSKVKALPMGNGFDTGVEQGPMINEQAASNTADKVKKAIEQGAELIIGGQKSEHGDCFYEPTILANVNDKMDIVNAEIFGPVAPIIKFDSEDEVIEKANDTEYGLASYIFTNDLGRSIRVSEALEYGMVGVNNGMLSTEQAPFGGIKQSGIGREGSKYGLDDYLEIKYISIGGI